MGKEGRIVQIDPSGGVGTDAELGLGGVTVEVVQSAEEALGTLERADCLVFEPALPNADPVEFCRTVRSQFPDVPLVAFPTNGTEALAGELLAAGIDAYVPRSAGVDTLVDRLTPLLEADTEATPFEASPLAIIEWEADGTITAWNEAASELFGHERADAVGQELATLLDVTEPLDTPPDGTRYTLDATVQDNQSIRTGWTVQPVDSGGSIAFVRDVTETEKQAQALEVLQGTTQSLLRAASSEAIVKTVLEATETVLDAPVGAVRLYDEDDDCLSLAGTTSAVGDRAPSTVGPDEGILWETFETGLATVLDDATIDDLPYELDIAIGSAVLHPLGDHGLFAVASAEGTDFDVTDLHLISVLATSAKAALERRDRERNLERTRKVIDSVGDSVYALDKDGHFVMVNKILTEKTGYSRDELLGRHVATVLTKESFERGMQHMSDLMDTPTTEAVTYEVVVESKDGEQIPAEAHSSLLWSDGEIQGTVGTVRDIRERKRIESELKDRTQKIETLHQIVALLEECKTEQEIFEMTVQTAEGVLEFDDCFIELVEDDTLVTQFVASTAKEDLVGTRTPVDKSLAGESHRTHRSHLVEKLTAEQDFELSAEYNSALSVPIGDHGVFLAVSTEENGFDSKDRELAELLISHVADSLERHAFEERLREERDRFVALFENVPDALVSARYENGEPIVDRVNPAFEDTFGYAQSDIAQEPLDQYIVPAAEADEAEDINRRGIDGTVEREVKRRTMDGLRDFMVRVVPIEQESERTRVFGLYTDITEQKQRQQRLQILNRVLRHDLRNGMNIISGSAEMLSEAVETGDAQYADAIQERADELISLAEKTRAVERTLGREDATAATVDLVDCVGRAVDRVTANYEGVNIVCNTPESALARADDSLENAIFHLLENAIEHNDASTPRVTVSIQEVEEEDDTLAVSIADNGPGLPQAERELLQEDKEITQLRHASGLGLWLVNWVITQSGGRLVFEENEPRGTVVTFTLPTGSRPETESPPGATASN